MSTVGLPLSAAQQEIWYASRADLANPAYHLGLYLDVAGPVDREALRQALMRTLAEADGLRVTFAEIDGEIRQFVQPSDAVALPLVDLAGEAAPDAASDAWMSQRLTRPWDLHRGPVFDFALLRLSAQRFRVYLGFHHMVIDGVGLSLFGERLGRIYTELRTGQRAGPSPFGSFTEYLREDAAYRKSAEFTEAGKYWSDRLADLPGPTYLAGGGSLAHDLLRRDTDFDPETFARVEQLAEAVGTRWFRVVLAVTAAYVARMRSDNEVLLSVAMAGRSTSLGRAIPTMASTVVPLRVTVRPEQTWAELIGQVADAVRAAVRVQRYRGEYVRRDILRHSGGPFFGPIVNFVPMQGDYDFAGHPASLHNHSLMPVDDLSVLCYLTPQGGLRLGTDAHPEHYSAAELDVHHHRLIRALTTVATRGPDSRVGDVFTPDDAERALLASRHGAVRPVPRAALPELFAAQLAATPLGIAVESEQATLTYAELDARSSRLGRRLVAAGVGPGSPVAVLMRRSAELVVAVLAVAKAGGTYVPLDLRYPLPRLRSVLADAGPPLLLVDRTTGTHEVAKDRRILYADDDLPAPAQHRLPSAIHPDSLLYVMYTSGSSGVPKGVEITHRAVAEFAADSAWRRPAHRKVLAHSPHAFDASTYEMWVPLLTGGRVVLAPGDVDAALLRRYASGGRITAAFLTTGLFTMLAEDDPGCFAGLAELWTGGEAGSPRAFRRVLDACPETELVSVYGPTETTTFATYCRLGADYRPETGVPIGRPMENVRGYVLDERGGLLSPGAVGHLHLAGAGLARGYTGSPGLTAARFRPDPFGEPGQRMYATGDLVRWRTDGELEFVGRVDRQVKLRGFRIEPGDIEAALTTHPGVAQAAVVVREDGAAGRRLVAYVVPRDEGLPRERSGQDLPGLQVAEWQSIYTSVYQDASRMPLGENFSGWNSSYDGTPLPLDEMAQWRDNTVAEITELAPRRVLEIGVGSGLLLARLAPHCEEYWGTDFSAEAIGALRSQLDGPPMGRVTLRHQPADSWDGIPTGFFDVVVLNSVVQYFPNPDYLADVLRAAVRTLAPGGALYVGDIRGRALNRAFRTAVELGRAGSGRNRAVLRRTIEQSLLLEKELLVDPEFFPALGARLDGVGGYQIRLKRGRAHNELTRYRYAAILHKTSPVAEAEETVLRWGAEIRALDEFAPAEQDQRIRLAGVPDRRVWSEVRAQQAWSQGDEAEAFAALSAVPGSEIPDPEDVYEYGARLGFEVSARWSGGVGGEVDYIFTRGPRRPDAVPADLARVPLSAYASDPGRSHRLSALPGDLGRYLGERLPDYMVPSTLVILDQLPLGAHGKLDRRALPAPPQDPGDGSGLPGTPREELLCGLFAEVLGLSRVGVDDGFFELGGHSLLAVRLLSRIRKVLGAEITVRDLFDNPTVARLAPLLAGGGIARRALTPMPHGETTPLSSAQRRLWFLSQLEGPSPTYNIPLAVRLSGPLDHDALRRALADVVERHETLRTIFPATGGEAVQRVVPAVPQLAVREIDDPQAAVAEAVGRGFDLARDLPIRAELVVCGPDEHILVLVLHHIAADGWSLTPLARDLSTAYRARLDGRAPDWTPLPVQYRDYTLWQREVFGSEDTPGSLLARQLGYWTGKLAGLPACIELPADRPRPDTASYRGANRPFAVDAETHRALLGLARRCDATLFMVLQAGLAALLTRLGAGRDIPIGTPVAGRTDDAVNGLVGFFVNTLVLRMDTTGDPSFAELLKRVRETCLAAYSHQDVPFEFLVEKLNPPRSSAHHPLFQISLALQNNEQSDFDLPGVRAEASFRAAAVSRFDLFLNLTETFDDSGAPAGLAGSAEFATDLFDAGTVDDLVTRWTMLLRDHAAHPDRPIGQATILTVAERRELLVNPATAADGPSLAELFEGQVRRTPDAVAVVAEGVSWSYRTLNARANQVAYGLRSLGVGPEHRVGVLLPPSPGLVAAVLGVLKAGGAYVPVDPGQPDERLRRLLADCAVSAIVAPADDVARAQRIAPHTGVWTPGPPDPADDVNPTGPVTGRNAAYVLYTSGSTGVPKGVVVPQRAVAGLAQDACWGDAHRRVLLHSPQMFDAATYELWVPLLRGGTVVAGRSGPLDTAVLAEDIVAYGVTALWLTAGLFGLMTEEQPDCFAAVEQVWTGGDVVPAATVRRLLEAHPALTVVNGYGPTETTTFATRHLLRRPPPATVPIGGPMDDSGLRVLDARLQPVPPRVDGELYISGPGLARGYAAQPGASAERFVADPYGPPGSRMYRTGDIVRWNRHGELEFRGRADDQVKIRGFRVEPGETESVLAAAPGVIRAAVVVRDGATGRQLVGYVQPGADGVDLTRVRAHLTARLPEYLVPAAIVPLERFPLTANGKLDRAALPAPDVAEAGPRQPADEREALLCGLFAEVLGRPRVGVDDDFFGLGGHSLLATRLVSRVRTALGTDLPVRALFDSPTVAGLSRHLDRGRATRPALIPRPRPARIPLSYAQHRMWFLTRLEGPSTTYNIPLVVHLTGAVDVAALQQALADVTQRHEALRTVFPEADGEPYQRVLDAVAPLVVRSIPHPQGPAAIATAVRHRFDLARQPPIHAELLRYGPEEHALVIVVHHIAADGWSLAPLARDLSTAYTARLRAVAPGWKPLPVQYTDYTLWQRDILVPDEAQRGAHRQLAYWSERLAGLPDCITLPADRPRPAVASQAGAHLRFDVDPELHRRLTDLARRHDVTLFMVLHAGLAALLTRLGAGTDLAVGSPVAGRPDSGLEDLVGLFVNTLVIRTDTGGAPTFTELLAQVRESCLAAYSHQDVPFELLVERLNPLRSASYHPLVQVVLALQNTEQARLTLPGLEGRLDFTVPAVARVDLFLSLSETHDESGRPDGIAGLIEYSTDLFDESAIGTLADRWTSLLRAMADDPDQPIAVDLLTAREREMLAATWRDRASEAAPRSLPDMFEAQVARTPDRPALIGEGTEWTYAELDARAGHLAARLAARGIGPERVVAVALPRSVELIAALLGTVKAGGAYMPIDPAYPADRIRYMLADAAPALMVTTAEFLPQVPAGLPVLLLDADDEGGAAPTRPVPLNLAYVVYTSGSTGRPKGVGLTHEGITDLTAEIGETLAIEPGHRVLQVASPSFDASLWDVFGALLRGGTLVLAPPRGLAGDELAAFAAEQRLTHLTLPTAMLSALRPGSLPAEAVLTVSGDVCTPRLAADWSGDHVLYNGYGPTEVTIGATMHRCAPDDARGVVPIGRPLRGERVYVLDEHLRLALPGVVGDLYVAGTGLARGYVGMPATTAARLVADPFGEPGARMYRTGDLGRWNNHGRLEFAGRADNQVKFRGFRVELGEIESVLAGHTDVAQVAVTVREDSPGVVRLVAYVVPAGAATIDARSLRELAATRLPEYMVPSAYVELDDLRLNVNGKVDHRALPRPAAEPVGRAPRTPHEELLCGLFAEVLGLPRVSPEDSFFALGGHSLLVTKLARRISAVLGVDLPMQAFFDTASPAALAGKLADGDGTGTASGALGTLLPLRPYGRHAPLFCVPPVTGLSWAYAALLGHLGPDFPVYGLQPRALTDLAELPHSVEDLVGQFADEVMKVQPDGAYRLLGWSFGGMMAHALAAELERRGRRVALLALLDTTPAEPTIWAEARRSADVPDEVAHVQLLETLGVAVPPEERPGLTRDRFLELARTGTIVLADPGPEQLLRMIRVMSANRRIVDGYTQEQIGVPALHFIAADEPTGVLDHAVWQPYLGDGVETYEVASDHLGMTSPDAFRVIGPILERRLRSLLDGDGIDDVGRQRQ